MGQSCGIGSSPPFNDLAAQPKNGGSRQRPVPPSIAAAPHVDHRREEDVRFQTESFKVSVTAGKEDEGGSRRGWRSMYALGPVLGDGISAKVYEAEALTLAPEISRARCATVWSSCSTQAPCFAEHGRRVAIKRFYRAKSRTFKKELMALQRVGVHPHILRLLESYEGFDGEDVLVLEYCDGSTVYDLYARAHPQGGLPERLIARLIRQLLLALEHLTVCGVEHQDVKPENMMLYDVSLATNQAELKLGDFGWAVVVPQDANQSANVKPPATGAGSLWYAPPELNPPVKGIPVEPESLMDVHGQPHRGRSDMWSVGVVVYLLLVGHNPFNLALKLRDPAAADAEVLRLAALGQFNRKSEKWFRLNADAQDFVSLLLRVKACARPSASDALHHPFLTRRLAKNAEASVFFHGPVSNWHGREEAWRQLDGLQQLAWMAMARAVAEPELDRQAITAALDSMQALGESRSRGPGADYREGQYLWQLARELGTTPITQWLQQRPVWTEVVRLAFSYLDVDSDGVLSANDLAAHVAFLVPGNPAPDGKTGTISNSDAWSIAGRWVLRWQDPDAPYPTMSPNGFTGLSINSFRLALSASHCNDPIFEPFENPDPSGKDGGFDLHDDKDVLGNHPSFTRVVAGPRDHEEEEINWDDMKKK